MQHNFLKTENALKPIKISVAPKTPTNPNQPQDTFELVFSASRHFDTNKNIMTDFPCCVSVSLQQWPMYMVDYSGVNVQVPGKVNY